MFNLDLLQGFDVVFVAVIAFAIFVLVSFARAVRSVPQGYQWTAERFGRFVYVMEPGLRFMIPLIDSVGHKLNMMETVLDIDGQVVITRDNAQVRADAVAFYQIIDAPKAAYEVRNLELALQNLSMTNIRSVIGAMDLDDVLSNRDMINSKLLQIIDDAATPWGVKVTRVEIKDLEPPADIVQAMGSQMKAEREKRAEVLTAEGEKQAAILKAEGLKESQIREAEGRREAAFLDAEARERQAEAEAKATQMVSAAIAEGDVQAINYFVAQKYTDALAQMGSAPNAKTIFLPIEAASIAGAVAGIAELTGARGSTGGASGGGGTPRSSGGGGGASMPWDS